MEWKTCRCAGKREGSGRYLFLGPDGGHYPGCERARCRPLTWPFMGGAKGI
jgi:hypothetical protein